MIKYIVLFFLTLSMINAEEKNQDNYVKSENIVINIDKKLMWQDNPDTLVYTSNWTLAKEYCKTLSLNGYTDWKLPSIKVLQEIVDISKFDPAINENFKHTQPSSYWSSSADMKYKNNAWYVGFKTGATFKDSKDYNCYVRCVRTRFKK
ncbi:MAG: DUF1566 domain-containing protein [Campylobacterota bacterium]|nr:DUF1566 domain-containing protein [Campylobacterota bacterium]